MIAQRADSKIAFQLPVIAGWGPTALNKVSQRLGNALTPLGNHDDVIQHLNIIRGSSLIVVFSTYKINYYHLHFIFVKPVK